MAHWSFPHLEFWFMPFFLLVAHNCIHFLQMTDVCLKLRYFAMTRWVSARACVCNLISCLFRTIWGRPRRAVLNEKNDPTIQTHVYCFFMWLVLWQMFFFELFRIAWRGGQMLLWAVFAELTSSVKSTWPTIFWVILMAKTISSILLLVFQTQPNRVHGWTHSHGNAFVWQFPASDVICRSLQ